MAVARTRRACQLNCQALHQVSSLAARRIHNTDADGIHIILLAAIILEQTTRDKLGATEV